MNVQIDTGINARSDRIAKAWKRFAPTRVYYGFTLAKFKEAVQPSSKARAEVEALRTQLRHAQARRDAVDRKSREFAKGVVSGILADRDHGDDSEFYAAMGYVRSSARRKPAIRKKKGDRPASDQLALCE